MSVSSFFSKLKFWTKAAGEFVPALRKHGRKAVFEYIRDNYRTNRLEAAIGRYLAEQAGISQPPNAGAPQGHLPASAAPRQQPAGFILDLQGLTSHVGRWHEATAKRGAAVAGRARPDLTFIVHATADTAPGAVAATQAAIKALVGSEKSAVRVLVVDPNAAPTARPRGQRSATVPSYKAALEEIADADFVIHLQAGDTIYGTALTVLDDAKAWDCELAAIDGYWQAPNGLYHLQLHLAADPLHLANCDCLHSRFLCSAAALKRAAGRVPELQTSSHAYALLRDLALGYRAKARSPEFMHVPVPLFEIADLPRRLQSGRRELIVDRKLQYVFGPQTEPGNGAGERSVAVVIATKARGSLLRGLVEHLDRNPDVAEVVLIGNNVEDPMTVATLNSASIREKFRVIRYDHKFNFSRMCNIGASICTSSHILFLNDDIVLVHDDWLEQLLKPFDDPRTAAAGMLLLYPNESVQHAGMFLGYNNSAGHLLRHATVPAGDYGYAIVAPRQVSCVTGAALLVDREKFEAVNGFDEQLAHYLQDVDLCLRLDASGWRVIYQPGARALHMESVTILESAFSDGVREQRGREHQHYMRRWGAAIYKDPWLSPAISYRDEALRTLT